MHKLALVTLLAAIVAATCSINVQDIQSLYESTSGSRVGRLMIDLSHNRLIVTEQDSIKFIDTKSKAIIPITLNHTYSALQGEFMDNDGRYYVFGYKTASQPLTLISIDGFGKFLEKPLVNLQTLGCVLYAKDSQVFLTTRKSGVPLIVSYNYLSDNITGGVAMIEDYSDNDCIRFKDTGYFATQHYMIQVDMTNYRIIQHLDTKLVDSAIGYSRLALDQKHGKIYVTYSQNANILQFDVTSHQVVAFKGDAGQYSGFLGLATHPSDGSVYFFTTALQKSSVPSTAVIEVDRNLQMANIHNVPNDIFLFRRGHFDMSAKRMYVLGYSTPQGHMNVFSVAVDTPWYLSTAAIIGISVGGGVALILLLGLIITCLFMKRRSNATAYEEKSRLLGTSTTYISTA